MRVLIRCDASWAIGSGHVMRCRNLGRALQRRGTEVLFLCRERPGDLIALLSEEFGVLRLPAMASPETSLEGLQGREFYGAWLGCSQLQDADDCLNAIRPAESGPIDWLVVDHYGLDQSWERRICESLSEIHSERPRLLVFDDLADRPHQADVLVDANRLGSSACEAYRPHVPASCRLLLGPAYAPLDPLYGQLQPLAPQRSSLRRVLMFFGGVDQANHSAFALEALGHPEFADLAVDVVLGAAAPHHATVAQLVRQRPHTQLHSCLPSLAGLMLRADLAIGAAGTASWERAALALPTLVTPVAGNQRQGAQALADAGAALLTDLQQSADPGALILEAIRTLLKQPERLQQLSARSRSLGDGRGLGRLLTTMLGPTQGLRLRPATLADEGLYLAWANEPKVRRQSFNMEPIPFDQHQRWFRSRLQSTNILLRVLVDAEGLPLGQIRFERSADEPARATIGFSLDPAARGYGLASELLQLGVAELARHWGAAVEAYGEVRVANAASAKAFLRAGFVEGPPPRSGVRCFSSPACSVS
ncbi:MAG: UDP-2,4-diacetamido-2,4,6-trideoxy-beta-L-altropyranose hydrolase [Cyanobacteria bacterium K_DeepCast_150m_m2_101]|nr:UDP-2,4-diacetamido-2,4,6-trideoxy-beta-L-altropyranose hydrolase [Cyanobacteria bacterium K_DeepCast_35m_m1_288]MBM5796671.1 UDP-2,4-diacetamido-2,4,6-trideoxy-beta-L-altropyranose hydrolase [Cyanobacteria bacterium K_Offshore_0m_m2_072]MBM5819290.1 UDP-2,4-diacetamido-2,4,6-trideoxy-beta-L-altropyranose hydrolase [Cyanobacteria bacterium K_DeepCast_150m_m2_101]